VASVFIRGHSAAPFFVIFVAKIAAPTPPKFSRERSQHFVTVHANSCFTAEL